MPDRIRNTLPFLAGAAAAGVVTYLEGAWWPAFGCGLLLGLALAQYAWEVARERVYLAELKRIEEEPALCTVLYAEQGYDGAGWYYGDTEHPEDGMLGAFATLKEALVAAQSVEGGGYAIGEIQMPESEGA